MKIVDPDDITTLVINKHYFGVAFCTARAALRHLMTGRFNGEDATGNMYTWDGVGRNIVTEAGVNHLNWGARNLAYYDDQPALRSSAGTSGGTVEWAIPTIVLCTSYFGYKVRSNEKVSLRKLYRHYKGICQLCLKHGSISDMTIDHVLPRALGGSNHDFNLVLAHRDCNCKKGAHHPYLNAAGQEVKAVSMLRSGVMLPANLDVRVEWKPYLFME
jgi:hypothetical protein